MRYTHHIFTCTNDKTCGKYNSEHIQKFFKAELKARGLKESVRANKSGCLDGCDHAPVTVVYPEGIWYRLETEADALEVITQHIVGGKPVERLMVKALNPRYDFPT
jgi:(2Fe-2S) ferredoxin